MTHKDLEELGFKKEYVSAEESGNNEYVYYTYDFFEEPIEFCLMSSASDNVECYVEMFNTQEPIRYYDIEHVKEFITIVKKGIVS